MNDYGTEIKYYSKRNHSKKNYYNFYNDIFNFRKIGNISLSQQTYTTNNTTKSNNQTITYAGNDYLNNDKIATVISNTVPSLTDNYFWILETSDNVAPGLDSLLTYAQSKYATSLTLQHSII